MAGTGPSWGTSSGLLLTLQSVQRKSLRSAAVMGSFVGLVEVGCQLGVRTALS